jgi:hypothetical protein
MQPVSKDLETKPDRLLTVVAMNTTDINTDTTYTTLHHVPSGRASLGAAGSLVADCHVLSKAHEAPSIEEERAASRGGGRGKNGYCICRADRGIDIERPRDIKEKLNQD